MIYIDTGAFLARYLKNDQYHEQAIYLWKKITDVRKPIFTSNFVLDETLTLLGRWAGNVFAVQKGKSIYASNALSILRPDRETELKALDLMGKYADHPISFTDCVSFVLMKRQKIYKVFSFDSHFEFAGFTLYT